MRIKQGSLPKIIVIALVLACLLTIALGGCKPQSTAETTARVIVTQDFGHELMLDESVIVANDTSALDALAGVATVETKYGGGFIEAINGIRSQYSGGKVRKDWFFYINGLSANVGVLDYKLCDGDVEHWDFHDWSFHAFIPAIIGDFPQPFAGGYQGKNLPTIIVYDEGFRDTALDLVGKLEKLGIKDIRAQGATELSFQDKEHSNLILLGTRDFDLISELNENRKLGFYIHFEDDKTVVYDSQGNETQYKSGCGLIQATQNPWNPKGIGACENVVWLLSGTNESQVQSAVDILTNHHEEFRYAYATVIVGEEVIKVPR